jgi:hypothetical protein
MMKNKCKLLKDNTEFFLKGQIAQFSYRRLVTQDLSHCLLRKQSRFSVIFHAL